MQYDYGHWTALVAGDPVSRNKTALGIALYSPEGKLTMFRWEGVHRAIQRGDLPPQMYNYQPEPPATFKELEDILRRDGHGMSVVRWENPLATASWEDEELARSLWQNVSGQALNTINWQPLEVDPSLERESLSEEELVVKNISEEEIVGWARGECGCPKSMNPGAAIGEYCDMCLHIVEPVLPEGVSGKCECPSFMNPGAPIGEYCDDCHQKVRAPIPSSLKRSCGCWDGPVDHPGEYCDRCHQRVTLVAA